MCGLPYDDLDGWRAVYPVDVFIDQLEKVASGFDRALARLPAALSTGGPGAAALALEMGVAMAAALHFRSVAAQARFVRARRILASAPDLEARQRACQELEQVLTAEIDRARHLYLLQQSDPRLGFEASNQYYYVPLDLAEKALNCRDLLDRWLPTQRAPD
jgi:hypothetical protein